MNSRIDRGRSFKGLLWSCVLAGAALARACHAEEPRPTTVPTQPAVAPNKLDRATGMRLIHDFTLEGMDKRLGPDYTFYHRQKTEKFPEIYLAPAKQDHGGRRYQIGGPWDPKNAGDFSSTQGQIAYVPDAGAFPVDRVTILEWSDGCFTESPEPPWHGGFRPEPTAAKWKQAAPGGNPGVPIGMARGMARGRIVA